VQCTGLWQKSNGGTVTLRDTNHTGQFWSEASKLYHHIPEKEHPVVGLWKILKETKKGFSLK